MKFSICLEAVFNKKDFFESAHLVKNAGFSTIEFWSWWDKDIDAILSLKKELNLNIQAFCVPFTSLVDPTKRQKYLDGLNKSIEVAKKLDCNILISQVGNSILDVTKETQIESIIYGLESCVPSLKESGITLVFEPLNTIVDHKGYFLSSSKDAFQITNMINSPNIKVLYDIYHQLVMGEIPEEEILPNIENIGHFHAAGYPGRHELDSGQFSYMNLLKSIDETNYTDCIGIEYFPLSDPLAGLKKLLT